MTIKTQNLGKIERAPCIGRIIQRLRPRQPGTVDLEIPIRNGDVVNQAIVEEPIGVLLGNHLHRVTEDRVGSHQWLQLLGRQRGRRKIEEPSDGTKREKMAD